MSPNGLREQQQTTKGKKSRHKRWRDSNLGGNLLMAKTAKKKKKKKKKKIHLRLHFSRA
jgi:hypothetical protein